MPVRRAQGRAMVAIPGVGHRLPGVFVEFFVACLRCGCGVKVDFHCGALHAREGSVGARVERGRSVALEQPDLHALVVIRGAGKR